MSATLYDINSTGYFSDLVQSTYSDLGEPDEYSPEYIALWYVGNSNLGRLNSLIDSDYSGIYATGDLGSITGYGITPDLGDEEQAIYKKLFELGYYNKQTKYALQGCAGLTNGNDWIALKEGDSSIQRVNKNEVAKTFRGLAQDCRSELTEMIRSYLKFNTAPEQVVGDDTVEGGYYMNSYSLTRNRNYDHGF